jgi:hypothetical protein
MADDALREHMLAEITPEKVARMRARIGIRRKPRRSGPPFNTVITEDTIRHWVNGLGDDNPLFCDPAYAARTRWGEVVAPLHYLNTMGEPDPDTPALTPAAREALSGGDPLRGIHAFYSGTAWEWWNPLRPGRRVYTQNGFVGIQEKRSDFANRSVFVHHGASFRDSAGSLVAFKRTLMIHTERKTAAEKKKYAALEPGRYSPEDVARIDDAYANEFRRGDAPLAWEDVAAGQELGPMVKGPLMVTDIIFWHVGGNETGYNLSPLRLAYLNRQKIPAFYLPTEYGYPDAAQRCHWELELAQAVGNPMPYDYGAMREAWLAQFVYNWMGDNGWLWKFHSEMRRFNYLGDVTWIRGRVVGKAELPGPRFSVDLELWGENQRGEVSTIGSATVLLPSREHPEVLLPDPPGGSKTIDELFDAVARELA